MCLLVLCEITALSARLFPSQQNNIIIPHSSDAHRILLLALVIHFHSGGQLASHSSDLADCCKALRTGAEPRSRHAKTSH